MWVCEVVCLGVSVSGCECVCVCVCACCVGVCEEKSINFSASHFRNNLFFSSLSTSFFIPEHFLFLFFINATGVNLPKQTKMAY